MIYGIHRDVWVHHVAKHLSPISLSQLSACCRVFHTLFSKNARVTRWRRYVAEYTVDRCFEEASKEGDIELVDFFIEKGGTAATTDWNSGLYGASEGGHRDLVNFFIEKGANYWTWGLQGASEGGHRELVDFFIEKGATDWNSGLRGASEGGHRELVDFFIEKGGTAATTDWYWAISGASQGGHRELMKYLAGKRDENK